MTIEAKTATGKILTFPDGTDPAVIQKAVKDHSWGGSLAGGDQPLINHPPTQVTRQDLINQGYNPAEGMGPGEAFRKSFMTGGQRIGRAMGFDHGGFKEPDVVQSYDQEQINQRFPKASFTGELVGEAAPFAAAAGPIGGIASTGLRVAASTILGAIEGWYVARGHDADNGQAIKSAGLGAAIGGTLEAVIPYIGRTAGRIYRNVRGKEPPGSLFTRAGAPTEELSKVMSEAGVTLDDLVGEGMEYLQKLPPGSDPAQSLRAARFSEIGVPATRGDVTQRFAHQQQESRLLGMGTPDASQPLRELRLSQSDAFSAGVRDIVDSMGISAEDGNQVKLALEGRLSGLTSRKNDLYATMAQNAPDILAMPLFTDNILKSLPSPDELRRAARLTGNDVKALQELMVEFGIDQSQEAVEAFTRDGGKIMPLSIGNLEEFRVSLNAMGDGVTSGGRRTSYFTGQIKNALDAEGELIDNVLQSANITDKSLLEPIKEARKIVRTIKTEFSPASIAGRLIRNKTSDGFTPIIEASRVYDSILGNNTPIEYLQRTVDSLVRSGDEGITAMGNLQSTAVLRAMERSLAAPSQKTNGMQLFNYSTFYKELEKIGDDRLDVLFTTNKEALRRLRLFKDSARDLAPDAMAMPKGSGHTILDVMGAAGNWPGIAAIKKLVVFTINAGSDQRAVRTALKNSPDIRQAASMLQSEFPAIASSLGIVGGAWLLDEEE